MCCAPHASTPILYMYFRQPNQPFNSLVLRLTMDFVILRISTKTTFKNNPNYPNDFSGWA